VSTPGAVDPDQLSLLPRPEPDPEVLAVLAAAVQQAWPRPVAAEEPEPPQQTWRFSGRWWNKPASQRRDRPWAGG
jgi:hypothetical protein